ncbi:MAG: response regulator [Planctomycetes bacterium]|nr:response regulator [Planctomycetota bacterium]
MAEQAPSTPERTVRVLLIDDDEDDYILTRELLEGVPGAQFQIEWEPDADAALDSICRGDHDVYIIDFLLGRRTGLEIIEESVKRNCSAPLILLTGQGKRELDFAAMRAGAADYLEKGNLDSTLLERSIRYAIQKKQSEDQLDKRVQERTAELARINEILQGEIRERERAEKALREIVQRKDEFLATLAHELRNPLAPIRNALEIMRLGAMTPDTIERCRSMMQRQVSHMVRLIDDLLDISRITRGKIALKMERICLDDAVAVAIEGSQPLIDARNHVLTVRLPDEPICLTADSTRLTQILINLLNNAAKYTEPGGEIELTASLQGSHVVLRVKDTGIGIPSDLLPHIFDMFAQVDHSRDHAQGGLGIGLSLVRGLVELHGGTVDAHSNGAGSGSEFIVKLPISGGA